MPNLNRNTAAAYAAKGTRYKAVVYDPDTGATDDEAEYPTSKDAISFAKHHNWDAVIDQVAGQEIWRRDDTDLDSDW